MITSFVRNQIACWRCTECGAEAPILHRFVRHESWSIDMAKTLENTEAFQTRHALCKNLDGQLALPFELREKHPTLTIEELNRLL